MITVLEQICNKKREHVAHNKDRISQDTLEQQIDDRLPRFTFEQALNVKKEANTTSIIAEIKKASPSKGVIRADFDPISIANNYESSGATCISCLTDTPYFQGCDDYLVQTKSTVKTPVLRKDFMIDLYQIYESRVLGADAILIIMAALDISLAKDMYHLATELGMSALFEVHDLQELESALSLSPKIVGVNNRNLKTLDVSLETSHTLAPFIPDHIIRISESGIKSKQDIETLKEIGYDGFLIGESLMNKSHEGTSLETLIGQESS